MPVAEHKPKRAKVDEELQEEVRRAVAHPYGIRPEGNRLFSGEKNCRDAGLGVLKGLTDVCVGEVLGYLQGEDLCKVTAVSRSLYAFGHADDLWKPLTLFALRADGKFFFADSWKQTFINTSWAAKGKAGSPPTHTPIKIQNFFSDTLYQPHRDATMAIPTYWTTTETVQRSSAKQISKSEFIEKYETPGIPVILTDLVTEWECSKWDLDYLEAHYGDAEFQCEAARLTIKEFATYCRGQIDDRPLYLFDAKFAETVPDMGKAYSVPEYFNDDLFKVLGATRPDYRWLIMGPTRSGSSFHKDPNSTDAWNACIRGLKKWVFFPPSVVPPGVMCSEDGADVTSPMSLVEWFHNYYDRCKEVSVQPLEALVRPGEMMYIPNGWWHLCLNLTPTICITQNYVSRSGLPKVLSFLRDTPHNISGICDDRKKTFYTEFRDAMKNRLPEFLEEAETKEENEKKAKEAWHSALEGDSGGFTFDF
eukprot:TRINITY_DN26234_c0_g1_i1.p1 TRINITY_DN26234_c0_g1~~TRINITY_DN26234_c0_g1_i1.p1  ORF type:complete len:477 (+),score=110.29 TRINITY_DN26234_c0_g1_i1:51-1481(+)